MFNHNTQCFLYQLCMLALFSMLLALFLFFVCTRWIVLDRIIAQTAF